MRKEVKAAGRGGKKNATHYVPLPSGTRGSICQIMKAELDGRDTSVLLICKVVSDQRMTKTSYPMNGRFTPQGFIVSGGLLFSYRAVFQLQVISP